MPNLKKVTPVSWKDEAKVEDEEKHYPTFRLKSSDLPALKDWDVGDDYVLVMRVSQKSKDERGKDNIESEFEIKALAPLEDALNTEEMTKFDNKARTGKSVL